MNKLNAPFRFDIVGSFLRPDALKAARLARSKGEISDAQLEEVEDAAIADLINRQKEAGLSVITDGEFRRATWHLDFMWAWGGIGHSKTAFGIPFHGENALIDDTYLTGKLSVSDHPFIKHFRFVKRFEDENTVARQTIPAPAQFLAQHIFPMNRERTAAIYPDTEELIADIASGYKKVIAELYDAGCRNIQFDDCTWGVCVDKNAELIFATDKSGLTDIQEKLLRVNNLAANGRPSDLVITTHICRGNFHSTWACSGGYDGVAELLFGNENVDAFYLEFDDERSGGFECLKHVAPGKKVVLGLVTTKNGGLEQIDGVERRIHEAAKYVPLDRLYLSPQCGFASTEEGNLLTQDEQWAKIALVRQIAKKVWG